MKSIQIGIGVLFLLCSGIGWAGQAEREAKVRGDRKQFGALPYWIYNDLDKAFSKAQKTKRPLLLVFR